MTSHRSGGDNYRLKILRVYEDNVLFLYNFI